MCLPINNICVSMENFIRKRIDIATCWATNRISAMDTLERYEDSYAIAEEFREWILHIGEKNENLNLYIDKHIREPMYCLISYNFVLPNNNLIFNLYLSQFLGEI